MGRGGQGGGGGSGHVLSNIGNYSSGGSSGVGVGANLGVRRAVATTEVGISLWIMTAVEVVAVALLILGALATAASENGASVEEGIALWVEMAKAKLLLPLPPL